MIIGIVGKAGAGKDTIAAMIPGARRFSFADPLKEFVAQVFDWDRDTLWGPSENRNKPDPRYNGLTPRHALQTLGTEWGRGCYEDVWAQLGVRRALAHDGIAVFTDCRFINEAKAIRESGGQVWRIVRPGAGLTGAAGSHPSELEQESAEMQALITTTIQNVGTLDDLRNAVQLALAMRPASGAQSTLNSPSSM